MNRLLAFLFLLPLAALAVPGEYYVPVTNQFDLTMRGMPPNCVIHIAPGTNFTLGNTAWGPKTGQHIIGAGKGLTVLMFPSNAVASGALNLAHVIGELPPSRDTNITIEGLTADCNYQPGTFTTLHGVGLNGSGNTIRDVDCINSASWTKSPTNYVEAWGIGVSAYPFSEAHGNLIENCSVSGFTKNFNNNLSALGLLENASGRILNNDIEQLGTNTVFGIYPGSHGSIVTGNILHCAIGMHYDDGTGVTNDIIANNLFSGNQFIDWANGICQGVQFHDNNITLTNITGNPTATVAAFYFHSGSAFYINMDVAGNMVSVLGQPSNPRFIWGNNMRGVTSHDNSFNVNLPNLFTFCTGVSSFNNYLYGSNHN